ncbi:MAG: hypothetical protein RL173_3611 [Fibrobacterota bacterium]|jgi:peptidoglycan/LPS O-acetylase OafA/YrhL
MGLIRLLLALSVVLDHSGPIFGFQLLGGELAVLSFYAISGFYMAMILEGPYAGKSFLFFRNRFLRLFPMYWTILVGTVAASGALWLWTSGARPGLLFAWRDQVGGLGFVAWTLVVVSTLFLFLQDALFFVGQNPSGPGVSFVADFRQSNAPLSNFLPVAPSWSLALELYFYLLAPWIVRWRTRFIAVAASACACIWLALAHMGLDFDPWTYRFFPSAAGFFLAGTLAWKLGKRWNADVLPKSVKWAVWLGVLLFVVLHGPGTGWRMLLFAGSIAATLPVLFSLSRGWKWDRLVGDISFPLYLVHLPVLMAAAKLPQWGRVALAIAVAASLQWLVGTRIERIRDRKRPTA